MSKLPTYEASTNTIAPPKLRQAWFWGLGVLMVLAFVLDVALGSVWIPPEAIIRSLLGDTQVPPIWVNIIYHLRLPRALTTALAGAALAVSGLQMQTLFQNPLAGPSVLGISAGAGLGVAIVVFGSGLSLSTASAAQGGFSVIVAAMLGAMAVLLLMLFLARRVSDIVVLLIVGVMVGQLSGALVSIGQYFSHPEQIQSYLVWTFGNTGAVSGVQLYWLAACVLLGLGGTWLSAKHLNALLLGETYAQSLGLPLMRLRLVVILMTGLMTGSVTAFCGPIAFIGIAVPHLVRTLLRSTNHQWLVPATALGGAGLLLLCDVVSKLPGSQISLPLNAITALIGAPVVIYVLLNVRRLRH
ncbi:FecCD family ABC transporter permease [Eisenibacter elegans]|jgi:iron complex transport system permease protein|uniref:FecCD family ABC transporter permease n=1 Tax=Eisenibacter elegans TaxID=997 RepID=UPI00040D5F0D|nr:iron ABC transporter permease [Eisenibacter elegans]